MRRPFYVAIAGLAALGLLALAVWSAGVRETVAMLSRLSVWQATALVATSFSVSAFTALAWDAILRSYGHRVSPWLLFRLTIAAFAAGWAIPSGFVAGIPVAAYFLRRKGVPFSRGLASFSISRFLELTAYALILPMTLLSELGSRPAVRAAALLVVAAVAIAYLDLFRRWRLVRRTLTAVRRVLPRIFQRPIDAAIGFCRDVASFFRAPWRFIVGATAWSFAAIAIALVRALATNAFLDLHLTTPQVVVMFAITIFLMAVPFLPGAIGAYEGGIAGAFELVGRSRAEGIAYAVAIHASELVVVVAGFTVLAQLGIDIFRSPKVPVERPTRARRRPHGRRGATRVRTTVRPRSVPRSQRG